MKIHAHIETRSQDCEGVMTSGHTVLPNEAEKASEFGDIKFHNRVVASLVNTYSLMDEGTLTVRRLGDGDIRMTWHEPTEEGHRVVEATLCTDPCENTDDAWQRDHAAEALGY